MRVALFSAKKYERELLDELNANHRHELHYFDALLEPETVSLAEGFPVVSVFTNDTVDGGVLKRLAAGGTKLVATRSTGFNQIDVCAAKQLGVKVDLVEAGADRKSTRLNSSHRSLSRMPSSA